jgi:hypothetical protein
MHVGEDASAVSAVRVMVEHHSGVEGDHRHLSNIVSNHKQGCVGTPSQHP